MKQNMHRARLEATSIEEFTNLFETYAIEFTKNDDSKLQKIIWTYQWRTTGLQTTHGFPIDQRSTGWQYIHINEMGWHGRVRLCYDKDSHGFFNHKLDRFGIYTGTGGHRSGEGYQLEYDLNIYIKDIPHLYREYMEFVDKYQDLYDMYKSKFEEDRALFHEILGRIDIGHLPSHLNLHEDTEIAFKNIMDSWKLYSEQPVTWESCKGKLPLRNTLIYE